MQTSEKELMREAKETGFRPEIMEKVWHLMAILDGISVHPFLKERLVLKGGTALNLFYFNLPRLSVDIDLNYIGSVDRNTMIEERKELEAILIGLCERSGFTIKRVATEHAGGKWRLNYASVVQPGGN